MTHSILDLPTGWKMEFLADDSDKFIKLITDYTSELISYLPIPLLKNEAQILRDKYISKITEKEDLRGCSFVKFVKSYNTRKHGLLRAEVRIEESYHNKEIEVEGAVFIANLEEITEREIILFRELELKKKTEENEARFKARASVYGEGLMIKMDEKYSNI